MTEPTPTPTANPLLAAFSPLLAEAVSTYPASLKFVSDGLSPEEQDILSWADSRLFANANFQASKYGTDKWPSEVKGASVQAIPLLMQAIDIQKKPDGKHVINWELDSLDRILDDLGIYVGVCTSCYGRKDYDTEEKVYANYNPIVNDPRHVHREMLKTFAYFARVDGEGIMIRSFMENDANDLETLYKRYTPVLSVTRTSFGWGNVSFMSQVKLEDGSVKSFPTMVYEIVGDAESHRSDREVAEWWFGHLNGTMSHFTGDEEDFADIYRPYSQTPYTPEPGYVLMVGLAGSPSSTGLTVSALRLLGLKAEQFFSAVNGKRAGSVELGGSWYYHDGNSVFWGAGRNEMPMCIFLAPLESVEDTEYDEYCGFSEMEEGPYEDRAALIALYDATGGPDWRRNQNWLSDRSIVWWRGVAVDGETGEVKRLTLTSNGLRGELPSELGDLKGLEVLRLAGNPGMTGCVPVQLRGGLRELTGAEFCDGQSGQVISPIEQGVAPVSSDRVTLVALYNSTDGTNWGNNDNWLSDESIGEWSGVTVDASGRVVRLDLARQRLSGEIPFELGDLEMLRQLNLGHNSLTGGIPMAVSRLANLESLYLAGNRLVGPIPAELGHLSKLRALYLSLNQLEGEIPPELGGLSNLERLYLNRNNLVGEIPPELGNLTNLIRLDLQYNGLTGQIPKVLGNPKRLRWLYLVRGNQFTGCIPAGLEPKSVGQPVDFPICAVEAKATLAQVKDALTALHNATGGPNWKNNENWLSEAPVSQWHGVFAEDERVVRLELSDNNLAGPIPPDVGSLSDLKLLDLSKNQLRGTIPSELGNLSELKWLSLESNQLTGSIPAELANLSSLVQLYLAGNDLSGEIPPGLGKLGLIALDLSDNELSGPIPEELGSFTVLMVLDLAGNQLIGSIPAGLGRLSYLKRLFLQNNQLTGEVPQQLGKLSNLEWLYLAGNQLEGCLPEELEDVQSNDFADSTLPFC